MRKNLGSIFGGILLIAAGVVALLQTQGYLTDLAPNIWVIIFAGISVLFLALYFISGVEHWGLLFPVGIFGALAFLIGVAVKGEDNPAMAAPLFVGIGLPFVVAFLRDTKRNWWALIPSGVMAFLTIVLLIAENTAGDVIGAALFFVLAITFGLVYAVRRMLWAAIVAYVMLILGFTPLIAMSEQPDLAGIVVMFGIALPFLFIYLRSPETRWWAVIPGGILATIGVVIAIVLLIGEDNSALLDRIANVIIYLGIALTFVAIWLRHKKQWGMWVAIVAALLAIISAIVGDMERSWPILLVIGGGVLLYRAFREKAS
jgi:hypothetical protein